MGLKPPPRNDVVALGKATAVGGGWRGQAERHAPESDVADDAIEVTEDHEDQVLAVEAVVDEARLVLVSMRWLYWCPKFSTRFGPLASLSRWYSRGWTLAVPLSILAKMALISLKLSSL